MEKVPGVLK